MKSICKVKWLGTLAALLFALVPQMRAQDADDLQEYLDQLASQQTESQRIKSPRKGQSIEIPVGLTEVDLSKFSYQNRTKTLTVKASVKFTNGIIAAASNYSGGTCLLKVYDGATIVLDATAGINAGAASSSNCLAAVGIYGSSTFYECGDITAPDNGTGIAIYKDGTNDTYIYVSGTRKGSIYPDDPFDLQKEIDAIAASTDKGSLESPIEIQLPEIYEITSPIIVPNEIFVRLKGGKLKIANSFSNTNNCVFHILGDIGVHGTLFIKDVTLDCNNKNLYYSFFLNQGTTYIEEGVTYQNINAQTGWDGGAFYLNEGTLYIASGTVRVSGNAVYGGGNIYMDGGVLQGSTAINTNGNWANGIALGSGPFVSITGGELIASGSVFDSSSHTYAGGVSISGGKITGTALFNQATYYSVNITGGQLNVNRLIELTGHSGGPGVSSVYIGGNVYLNVALNIGIHATSSLTSAWRFDCSNTDFNTISMNVGGFSPLISPSFEEKQLVVGYNGYELKEVDFREMTFNNVPDTLVIYYNTETKSVNVKRKVTYDELKEMLAEIKGRQDAWQTAYQQAWALYQTYSSYLSDEMKAEIEQRAQIVVSRITELIEIRKDYTTWLSYAPESDYNNLYNGIMELKAQCDAFEAQAFAALNALFEDAKAKAAADIAQKLQAIATSILNLHNDITQLQVRYYGIQSQLGNDYYFMRKPTEELNSALASADQNISVCTGLTSDATGLLQDLTSNHSISTAEDIDYFYAQILTINNVLTDAQSYAEAADGCLANANHILDALEVNFPDEELAFTIHPTNLDKELQLGYKSNRGFVLTSAGMMWFEQKEGADFYLTDAEGNYIVATSGSTTLRAGTKAEATVWTGESIGDGNYTFYSKTTRRYLGWSGLNVNNAIIADTKQYSWTITESELDDLQAFLNLLAEEEETGGGGITEKDTLDIVIPDIDPNNPVPDKPFVFPNLPYPIRILPTPGGGYWPIPRPTPGMPCPADFHPYHIKKGSHVIIDYATFQDLVGGHHVIYVEGVLEININIYVYLTNWEWFIHVGPGGRVIWRTTGGEGTPRIKNDGTMDIEGDGLDYVDNSGTINHKHGTVNWIVNRYIYYFTGGFINLVHNYGTYNHNGGDVITAKNFKEGTYTMNGGRIWNNVVNSTETVFYNYGKFYFYSGLIGGYGSRLIYHDKGAVMWIDGGLFDFTYVKNYWIEAHADYYIRGNYDYGATVPVLLAPSVTIRILYKWIYKFNIVFIDGRPTPRYPLFWARDFKFDISYFKYIDWQLPNKRWRWYVDEEENTIEPRDEEVEDEDDLQAYLDWLAENQDGEAASTEENPQELDLKGRDIAITKPVIWPTGCHVYIKNGRFTPKTSWTYNYIFYIPATTTVRYEYITINVSSTTYYYLNGVPVQRNIFEVYGDFHFGTGCYVEGYVNTSWEPTDTKIPGAVIYIDPEARFFLDGGSFKNVIFRVNTVVNIYVTVTIVNNIYIYLPTNCRYEDFSFMAPWGGYSFTFNDLQKIIFWNSGSWGIRVLPSNGYMTLLDKILATPIASIASRTEVEVGTQVELSCTKEGATIYYTLDGSDPRFNTDASIAYDGTPITLDRNTIIKAVAIIPDMGESYVATFVYYTLFGDLNNDNKIDIADGVCVLDYMAKDGDNELGDLNADGEIDIADFVAILDIMAKDVSSKSE